MAVCRSARLRTSPLAMRPNLRRRARHGGQGPCPTPEVSPGVSGPRMAPRWPVRGRFPRCAGPRTGPRRSGRTAQRCVPARCAAGYPDSMSGVPATPRCISMTSQVWPSANTAGRGRRALATSRAATRGICFARLDETSNRSAVDPRGGWSQLRPLLTPLPGHWRDRWLTCFLRRTC